MLLNLRPVVLCHHTVPGFVVHLFFLSLSTVACNPLKPWDRCRCVCVCVLYARTAIVCALDTLLNAADKKLCQKKKQKFCELFFLDSSYSCGTTENNCGLRNFWAVVNLFFFFVTGVTLNRRLVSPALRAESGTTTTTTTERERTERMKGITPTRINLQRRYTTNSSRSLVSFSFFFYGGTTKLCTGKKKPSRRVKMKRKKNQVELSVS